MLRVPAFVWETFIREKLHWQAPPDRGSRDGDAPGQRSSSPRAPIGRPWHAPRAPTSRAISRCAPSAVPRTGTDAIARCPSSRTSSARCSATRWRQQGVDPSLIAPAMGHADSRMVERVYGRLPPEDLRVQIATAASGRRPLLPICSGKQAPPCALGSITGVSDGSKIDALGALGGLSIPQIPREIVRGGGIEPPTRGFSVPCSTD
jgi:hypothetical protein